MRSFIIALLIFALIWIGAFCFCRFVEKNIDLVLSQTQMLSQDTDFSEADNCLLAHQVQNLWQENLRFLELAVEEEYLTPVTTSFSDLTVGCDSGDFSEYRSGKEGAVEGLLKLKAINKISISQIL